MADLPTPALKQLAIFQRQYWQLLPNLTFPDPEYLRMARFQTALYEKVIRADGARAAAPQRYMIRVLKELVRRIEASIQDWEEEGISDDLAGALAAAFAQRTESEAAAVQRRVPVIYTVAQCLATADDPAPDGWYAAAPTITLLESPNLISTAESTGMRTWEAALRLGDVLSAPAPAATYIAGKNVMELGAGTGYLSLLCARHLGARHVYATDGSADVMSALATNFFLNGLQESPRIDAMQYRWGHPLELPCEHTRDGQSHESLDGAAQPVIHTVVGADVTYDPAAIPALVASLTEVVALYPAAVIIIAATLRNDVTFQSFLEGCSKAQLDVRRTDPPVPRRETQRGPFYSDSTPIAICYVTRRAEAE